MFLKGKLLEIRTPDRLPRIVKLLALAFVNLLVAMEQGARASASPAEGVKRFSHSAAHSRKNEMIVISTLKTNKQKTLKLLLHGCTSLIWL